MYFAGWKQHYSVYPATERLRAAFEKELAGYEISKGTIRFPLSEPVPVRLIERIAKFLAEGGRARGGQDGSPKKRQAAAWGKVMPLEKRHDRRRA